MHSNKATGTHPSQAGGLGAYFQSISDLGRITGEDEVRLATQWRTAKEPHARERLITANLRLVIALAKRYSGRGVPLEELVAEGNVGLIHAADNFDPQAGCRFRTYAVYWIRQSIGQAFARAATRARLSRHDRQEVGAFEKAADVFVTQHGRGATGNELANALGWEQERISAARNLASVRMQTCPLTDALAQGTMIDGHTPEEEVLQADSEHTATEQLERLLATLTPIERRVIELRFGLDAGGSRGIAAVANILGMTKRAANAAFRLAMTKIMRKSRSDLKTEVSAA